MGSLRIGLKQSLQDATSIGGSSGADVPPGGASLSSAAKGGGTKKSPKGSSKFPTAKTKEDHDNGSSSEENEASLKNLEEEIEDDSSIEGDEEAPTPKDTVVEWSLSTTQEQNAAHQIQKHFRQSIAKNEKKKSKVRSSQAKKRRRSHSTDDDQSSQGSLHATTSWTVDSPEQAVIQHMSALSFDVCRQHMQPGLRVKVLFDKPSVQWYGGRVRRLLSTADGMRICIQYDDGTTEETNFPDRKYNDNGLMVDTVIVDAVGNGEHDAAVQDLASVYIPGSVKRTAPLEKTNPVMENFMEEEGKDEMGHGPKNTAECVADLKASQPEPSESVLVDHVSASVVPETDSVMVTEPQIKPTISGAENDTYNTKIEPSNMAVIPDSLSATATFEEVVLEPVNDETHSMSIETTLDLSCETRAAPLNPERLEIHPTNNDLLKGTAIVQSQEAPKLNNPLESMEDSLMQEEDTTKPISETVGSDAMIPAEQIVAEFTVTTSVDRETIVHASVIKPAVIESKKEASDIVDEVHMLVENDAPSTALIQETVTNPSDTLTHGAVAPNSTVALPENSSTIDGVSGLHPTESNANVSSEVGQGVSSTPLHIDGTIAFHKKAESLEVGSENQNDLKGSIGESVNNDQAISNDNTVSVAIREDMSSSLGTLHTYVESTKPTASSDPQDIEVVNDAEPVAAAATSKVVAHDLNPSTPKEFQRTERVKLTLSLKRPAPVTASDTEQPPSKKLTIRIPIPKMKTSIPATDVVSPSKVVSEEKSSTFATTNELNVEQKSRVNDDDTHRMELDSQNVLASSSPRQLKKLEKKRKRMLAASKNVENEELSTLKNEGVVDAIDGSSIVASKTSTVVSNDDKRAIPEDGLVDVDFLDGSGRSERRAAQHANERITAKSDVGVVATSDELIVKKKKKANRRKEVEGNGDHLSNAENEIELDDSQWVQCDKCGKWRIIPNSVVQLLPTQWYCADNVYDPKHASCDAPEQTDKDVAREKKKRLKKKQRLLKAAEEAATNEVSTPKSDNAKIDIVIQKDVSADRSPRPPRDTKEECEKQTKQQKRFTSTPLDETQPVEPVSDARPKKEKKFSSLTVKRGRSVESLGKMVPAVEEPAAVDATKPRGRGRPRRENTTTKVAATVIGSSSVPTPTDDGENLEWVQCEKCDKWRKLPPHVSADDLPDVWTCDMNNWNPLSASCDAPEDKSEGLQDIGVFGSSGSTAGKLTYRHLIFGSNGRKANRPVSEKTRAAESIFAAHLDEDDAPSKVLYSDSSVYVCRGRANLPNDENEGMSVLELMSHSQLWQELRGIAWSALPSLSSDPQRDIERMNSFVFDTLPVDMQDLMKEYVLHVLDTETLFVGDIVRQALSQNIDSLPRRLQPAHSYFSENVVVTTLCELVKTGRAECIQKIGSSSSHSGWNPYYRRKIPRELTKRSVPSHMKFSHLMKLSKPWKRANWRQQE
jgi:CW-type Zinc Finger